MKKILTVTIILCLFCISALTSCASSEENFTDVNYDAWYSDSIAYVTEKGLMNGTGNNLFEPDKEITRGMLVTILYRMSKSPEIIGECNFTDVSSNSYYENPIIWASKNGIVNGYNDSMFGPDDFITREQFATILYRYSLNNEVDSSEISLDNYYDYKTISSFAINAMKWANHEGYITGTDKNMLEPQGSTTRAQAATILMRYCEKNDNNDINSDSKNTNYNRDNNTKKDEKISSINENEGKEISQFKNDETVIKIEDITAKSGDTNLKIAVEIENNPGILGMSFALKYDEKALKLVSVETGEAVKDVLDFTKSKELGSGCTFVWDGIEIKNDEIKDGNVLILHFNVNENATPGKYSLELINSSSDFINNDLKPVKVKIENGSIQVK